MDIPFTLVENLDAIAIVRRMISEKVSKRRTLAVAEMVGWDMENSRFKTQEVFAWDAANDTYVQTGESHILDEIARQYGYSKTQIGEELLKRRAILEYMVRRNIRTYEDVSRVIM